MTSEQSGATKTFEGGEEGLEMVSLRVVGACGFRSAPELPIYWPGEVFEGLIELAVMFPGVLEVVDDA